MNLSDNPSITNVGWESFSRTLCNPTSIVSTYLSNHTICNLGCEDMPYELSLYLELNHIDRRRKGRQKILKHHFTGDFGMEPFVDMKAQQLVHLLAWFGRSSYSERREMHIRYMGQSALFQFLRREPSMFGYSHLNKVGTKKRTSTSAKGLPKRRRY